MKSRIADATCGFTNTAVAVNTATAVFDPEMNRKHAEKNVVVGLLVIAESAGCGRD
jgi:hypothetical protein